MFETTNQFRSCANSNVASFVRFHSPNSSKLACHPVNQLIRNEDSSSCHEHIVIEITMVFTSFFISGECLGPTSCSLVVSMGGSAASCIPESQSHKNFPGTCYMMLDVDHCVLCWASFKKWQLNFTSSFLVTLWLFNIATENPS